MGERGRVERGRKRGRRRAIKEEDKKDIRRRKLRRECFQARRLTWRKKKEGKGMKWEGTRG